MAKLCPPRPRDCRGDVFGDRVFKEGMPGTMMGKPVTAGDAWRGSVDPRDGPPAEASAWWVFCPWLTSTGPRFPGLPCEGRASSPCPHLTPCPSMAPCCPRPPTQAARFRGPSYYLLSPIVSNHFCPTDLTWGPDYDIHAAWSLPTLFLAGGHVASNAYSWNLHISRRALGPVPCSGVRHELLPQFPPSAHHRPPQAALTQSPAWNPILRPPVEHPSSHPTHIPPPLGPLGRL